MPKIIVEGYGTYDVEPGIRLVQALETHGVDILHRCGGFARCTTCRVTFLAGEPEQMTKAEHNKLAAMELLGQVRLSCQIICDQDMHLRPLQTLYESGLSDAGPQPRDTITPKPVWLSTENTENMPTEETKPQS